MLSDNVDYRDLGADHLVNLAPERNRRRAIRQLGYTVSLNPIEAALQRDTRSFSSQSPGTQVLTGEDSGTAPTGAR